jgi:hypothetical protein
MRSFSRFLLLLGFSIPAISAVASVETTFSNAVQYHFDTNGNAIDLTSGKIDFLGGAYIWYGLPFGCGEAFCGITSYSSSNLHTWHFNGFLFDPSTEAIQSLCLAPLLGNCGRPHIVYSAENNNYVLWVRIIGFLKFFVHAFGDMLYSSLVLQIHLKGT